MFLIGMADGRGTRRPQRFIDAGAKAVFLAALLRGARREDAAEETGFSLTAFYGARRRDPAFAAAWAEALARTPAAERRAGAYEARNARLDRGEVRIAPANRRLLQRRRRRHVRFTAERRELFLACFARDCDAKAAAAEAGVSESTVSYHVRIDPEFAAAYAEALREGYRNLEAETVRQRLAEQARLRAAIEAAGPLRPLLADQAAQFDRAMRLLARWDRKPRRPERRFREGGRRQATTFGKAMLVLERHLLGLGISIPDVPPRHDDDWPCE